MAPEEAWAPETLPLLEKQTKEPSPNQQQGHRGLPRNFGKKSFRQKSHRFCPTLPAGAEGNSASSAPVTRHGRPRRVPRGGHSRATVLRRTDGRGRREARGCQPTQKRPRWVDGARVTTQPGIAAARTRAPHIGPRTHRTPPDVAVRGHVAWRDGGCCPDPPGHVGLRLRPPSSLPQRCHVVGFRKAGQTQDGHADLAEATCHPLLMVDTGDSVRAHETTAPVVDAAGPATQTQNRRCPVLLRSGSPSVPTIVHAAVRGPLRRPLWSHSVEGSL